MVKKKMKTCIDRDYPNGLLYSLHPLWGIIIHELEHMIIFIYVQLRLRLMENVMGWIHKHEKYAISTRSEKQQQILTAG